MVLVVFIIIALLIFCRILDVKREMFTPEEEEEISSKLIRHDVSLNLIREDLDNVAFLTEVLSYAVNPLLPYYKTDDNGNVILDKESGYPILEFPKGDTGARGLQGLPGATGYKGDKGDKGDRGDHGIDGASIFDVSKYMLNGDTDLFKRKDNRKDSDKYDPQPVNAYTTLFD